MSLESMEQRTEGMKKQAQELIEFAYQRGVKAGHEEMQNQMHEHWGRKQKELIEQGRNEAWQAARKVIEMGEYRRKWEVFPELGDGEYPFDKLSASEVIAKIKAYEEQQKQEEEEHIEVDKEKVIKLADEIGIHKLFAIVKEIRGE